MTLPVQEPLDRVEDERLDAPHRHGAGLFAPGGAPHAVGDDHQVAFLVREPGELRLRQARPADPHRLGQLGDQELVLVLLADFPRVGAGTERHTHAGRTASRRDGKLTGRVVLRGLDQCTAHRAVLRLTQRAQAINEMASLPSECHAGGLVGQVSRPDSPFKSARVDACLDRLETCPTKCMI